MNEITIRDAVQLCRMVFCVDMDGISYLNLLLFFYIYILIGSARLVVISSNNFIFGT